MPWNQVPGTLPPGSRCRSRQTCCSMRGCTAGLVTPQHDVASHVDPLVGVVPIVNLEWIQKLIRDTSERGHPWKAVMDSVVRSMEDYINFITPQFSRTHINSSARADGGHLQPVCRQSDPSLDERAL